MKSTSVGVITLPLPADLDLPKEFARKRHRSVYLNSASNADRLAVTLASPGTAAHVVLPEHVPSPAPNATKPGHNALVYGTPPLMRSAMSSRLPVALTVISTISSTLSESSMLLIGTLSSEALVCVQTKTQSRG